MSESTFNKSFRARMAELGTTIYRFESHATCPGAPDNHYITGMGRVGWIEMKEDSTSPKVPATIKYRPHQVPWHESYSRKGGRVYTFLYLPKMKSVVVVRGFYAKDAEKDLRGCPYTQLVNLVDLQAWEILNQILAE